ncbi:hypothetical protein L5B88_25770 [Pseudomonas aeruginosa]|nr:hypothetical protein [Pseudomonas aeruginosa]
MGSLVLELQRDALDRGIHITDLLRKALLVSRKLKIKDLEEWIGDELNGYRDSSVPEYRVVYGELKAFNPYRGWLPIMVKNDWYDILCKREISLSVSQIENLARESENGSFVCKFSPGQTQIIMRLIGHDFEAALYVPTHHLVRILDTTKTKIMDFALDLESRGILGEDMTFTKAEQSLAQSITFNTINIEKMEGSQIQQATDGSTQSR